MSFSKSKTPLGLYDLDYNFIKKFQNQVPLSAEFNLYKDTIGRYVKSGKVFQHKYYIQKLNN